jgi:hypothetical protein
MNKQTEILAAKSSDRVKVFKSLNKTANLLAGFCSNHE